MAFITFDTADLSVPVLIPHAETPAVTGWNSLWIAAGAAALAWILFGSKIKRQKPEKKKTLKPFVKKAVTKTKRRAA